MPNHYLNQWWLIISGVCGIHLRAISHEILSILDHVDMTLKITNLRLQSHLPGTNELNTLIIRGHFYKFNTLRPRQTCRYFADDILKWIFLNENVWILLKISLKLVPKVRINNIPALDQIMAWRRPGNKPLSEPKMVWLLTHIYVTLPQWDA